MTSPRCLMHPRCPADGHGVGCPARRQEAPCMGEPYCAPELCGPPCHHPDCPVRSAS